MTLIAELIATLAIVIGGFFILVGSYGLFKLSAPMPRLHAPTKASTLGVGSILIASMLSGLAQGTPSFNELLIMAFLFVTAPVTGYFLSKLAIHQGRTLKELPPPPADSNWSTRL